MRHLERPPERRAKKELGKKGKPARLALIVKEKGDGKKERRIIVGHRRNGGNDKAKVPERPVLPLVIDAVHMMLRLMATAFAWGWGAEHSELVTGDFSDADFHFRVRPEGWQRCLSPDVPTAADRARKDPDPDGYWLLWAHLCSGLTAACQQPSGGW